MVTRENEHVVWVCQIDKVQVLVNRISRPAIPVCSFFPCIRRQDKYTALFFVEIPRTARGEVIVQFQRPILRQHADLVDARVRAITEWKIDDAIFAAKRYSRLRNLLRQCSQTAALPACQNHCQALCLSHKNPPWIYWW